MFFTFAKYKKSVSFLRPVFSLKILRLFLLKYYIENKEKKPALKSVLVYSLNVIKPAQKFIHHRIFSINSLLHPFSE